ncbi:hypothetical protein EVAR_55448_1 [Eumeta japonica]|uniref:Uncharacterized protein n=1 Tax=Eumeta variegata TaxID=151549 RepID=A0A4C1Y2K7_EUMVA|nr:hypothetical protein EVAR_55448_1 [Eumeta japonica]
MRRVPVIPAGSRLQSESNRCFKTSSTEIEWSAKRTNINVDARRVEIHSQLKTFGLQSEPVNSGKCDRDRHIDKYNGTHHPAERAIIRSRTALAPAPRLKLAAFPRYCLIFVLAAYGALRFWLCGLKALTASVLSLHVWLDRFRESRLETDSV